MYDKIDITENHLAVLSLFTNGFDKEYYVREVHKILKISPRTAQLMLEDLDKKGVLESKTKGKIKTYKVRTNIISQRYLALVEQYKSIAFFEKHLIINEIIEKITPFINGIGAIFGSYAKGLQKKDSDLDIFVAGECRKKEIIEVSETYGVEVSVKTYPLKLFEKNIKKDILIREVLDNHIMFLNAERFVGLVFEYG